MRAKAQLPRRLFFYGTLTHEHAHALTALLSQLDGQPRRAWMRGALMLKRERACVYPVLVPGPGRVQGWLYGGLRPVPRRVLAAFDAWEGHDPRRPGRGEYRRTATRVRTRGGSLVATVYLPARTSHTARMQIPGNDFAAYVARRGLTALCP